MCDTWHALLEELEPFPAERGRRRVLGHPGDVTARMREARDETTPDWIGNGCCDNRDRGGCCLSGQGCGLSARHHDIYREANELVSKVACPHRAIRVAVVDSDILALGVAEIAQTLQKGLGERSNDRGRAGREEPNARD